MQFVKNLLLSSFLPVVVFATTPEKPTNLVLVPAKTSVSLSWKDNSENESGFKIIREGKLIYTTKENVESYIDKDLTPNTTYHYTIMATNSDPDIVNDTGIIINEVVAGNIAIKSDPDFNKFSDYIELHNTKNSSVNIGGFYLSDDKSPTKWKIPSNTTIPSNGYILVWADKEDKKAKALHTNFSLSLKKEKITLADKSANVVDEISYKKLKADVAIQIKNGEVVYMKPTPDSVNSKSYSKLELAKEPIYSLKSGFYSGSQTVSLSQENGAKIYYTLDGSTPTKNSTLYTKAIKVSKTTSIRTKSIKDGGLPSSVVTKSYIINHEDYQELLPIVSISIDPKYLFDDYEGIYVVGKNGVQLHCESTGKRYNYANDWEKPVYIEYFNENRKKEFEFGASVSIGGECARRFPKKPLSFELGSKYGVKKLKYKLYPQKDANKFEDFRLRTGALAYMISDMLAASIVAKDTLNIDYQGFKIVQMYMNGEYWGVYHLREKKGKDYIASNYPDVDVKNIDIISTDVVKRGDSKEFNLLRNFVKNHDLSISSNYTQVANMIDLDNYIDYMSFMIFSGASDWLKNNTRFWKEKKNGAKWRWIIDDVDSGFISWKQNRNNFDFIKEKSNYFTSQLFLALVKNKNFKSNFKQRFRELLNGAFSTNSLLSQIDSIANKKKDYMHLEKWAKELSNHEKSVDGFVKEFYDYIGYVKEFAYNRNGIVKDQLDSF
jgi:uncharacterized protein YozE (UPF0346 family)